jgi:hypothetical protein
MLTNTPVLPVTGNGARSAPIPVNRLQTTSMSFGKQLGFSRCSPAHSPVDSGEFERLFVVGEARRRTTTFRAANNSSAQLNCGGGEKTPRSVLTDCVETRDALNCSTFAVSFLPRSIRVEHRHATKASGPNDRRCPGCGIATIHRTVH